MGRARFPRIQALAAAFALFVLLTPRIMALDAPQRWLATDSRCPWSSTVNGLAGRIVFADCENGQVFFELRNVQRQPLTVPWCVYCRDAGGLRPRDGELLPSGGRGQRCNGAQLMTLRAWDGTGSWQDVIWPAEGSAPSAVSDDGTDGPDYDLMSTCVLAAGERCLGVLARSAIPADGQCAMALILHRGATTAGAWSGTLEMGPSPWFPSELHAGASRATEPLPEHVAPLRLGAVADNTLPPVYREESDLNWSFQLNQPWSRAIATFRPADGATYYMGRVLTASRLADRYYLLAQAAALQTSDEALRKLSYDLQPASDLRVAGALTALSSLAMAITFPPATVACIAEAGDDQRYVLTQGGMESRSLASMVAESTLCTMMAYARQPAYRTWLRHAVASQHSLPAALFLVSYEDPLAAPPIVAALRAAVAQLQRPNDLTPQQNQEMAYQLYRLINGVWQLKLKAAAPLLLQVRQQRWCNGQIEEALSAIGEPAVLPGLQALRVTVAAGSDCGEILSPADILSHGLALDLAIAALQSDRSAALHALLTRVGDQPGVQTQILNLLYSDRPQVDPAAITQLFTMASSRAVCDWAIAELYRTPTRASTAALIDCLASTNANRSFADAATQRGAVPSLAEVLAMELRARTGCSLGDDVGLWRQWWEEVGSHLLGP